MQKKVLKPWTVKTCPLEPGFVLQLKDNPGRKFVVSATDTSGRRPGRRVRVCGEWYSYADLFELFELSGGMPCGEWEDAE